MKVIILAAGRGSRLGAITDQQPKCFANLWGKRIIEWELSSLKKAMLTEIGLVRGYKAELFNFKNVDYFENKIWDKSNMVRSLLCAQDWLNSQDFILVYSDIILDPTLLQQIARFELPEDEILVPANLNWQRLWTERFENPLDDAETYKYSASGYISEIGKKPTELSDVNGQYMGIVRFGKRASQEAFEYLNSLQDQEINKLDFTSFLQRLIDREFKLKHFPTSAYWLEIDSEVDLKLYNNQPKPLFLE